MLTTAKLVTIAATGISLTSASSISAVNLKAMEAAKQRYIEHTKGVVAKAKAAGQKPIKRQLSPYDDDYITDIFKSGYFLELSHTSNGNADCKGTTFASAGFRLGLCTQIDADHSFYWTCVNYEYDDDAYHQSLVHHFNNGDCSGEEETYQDGDWNYDVYSKEPYCDDDEVYAADYLCTTSTSPWKDLGLAATTFYYQDDTSACDAGSGSTAVMYNAYKTGTCINNYYFGYDGGIIGYNGDHSVVLDGCSTTSAIAVNAYNGSECDTRWEGGDSEAEFGTSCEADDDYDDFQTNYFTETCTKADSTSTTLCFHGESTVVTESGEKKSVSSISVGDRVLTINGAGESVFADVVFVPHETNAHETNFVNLKTVSGHSIRMTPEHLIPSGNCLTSSATGLPMVKAEDVRTGSCVHTESGMQEVASSSVSVEKGVYTIVTSETSGLVVVDGVTASSFGVNHAVANTYYHIHRLGYALLKSAGWHAALKSSAAVKANAIVGDAALAVGKFFRLA